MSDEFIYPLLLVIRITTLSIPMEG
ncbi:uncharacterized protein METZ01_LOCUS53485 [marine metagenome]|uniref:Uncharacterized protein n=1 Tax=marine metagenome TaxID=408172 RepID=A0A381SBF6_9ZZZZ